MSSFFLRIWLAFAFVFASLGASAQSADNLPPVDSVFKLSASGSSRELIEVRWQIAPGYYLYRHRTKVEPLSGFASGQLRIPPGQRHHDEFFGEVETYRGELKVHLPGEASEDRVRLQVKYQGCADIGICYPPQTRTLEVRLPAANPVADTGFAALGARLGGGAAGGGLIPGAGKPAPLPAAQAFRIEAIADGGEALLLRLSPAKGYYLYRDKLALQLADAPGIRLGKPRFPAARDYHDEHFGAVKVYFDEAEVPVPLLRADTARNARDITLHVSWQGCQDEGICYEPMRKSFRIPLPEAAAKTQVAASSSSEASAGRLPAAAEDTVAKTTADEPASEGGDTASPAPAAATSTPKAPLPATAEGSQRRNLNLWSALLLALLGGLILNLMPCVLPVLSLKALALAQSGESRQSARRHALWYSTGVLSAFAVLGGIVLALRNQLLAQGMGWGFQLQLPWVVATLALVMLALGLSLSGLWYAQIAAPASGIALSQKAGRRGDFFTGVLAVILATPCTAPFMGAALAHAFLAPAASAMLVFLMLGLGLALPFLLIGLMPALSRFLPKPGAWMETLKQLLAFPMYASAAWLVWVLVQQRGADAFALWAIAAISLTLALWALNRTRQQAASRSWTWPLVALAVALCIWSLVGLSRLPRPEATARQAAQTGSQQAYSPAALAALRAQGQAVFVNITADWCVTCKANERAVLSRQDFRQALAETGTVYMIGDHTDINPEISAFLQQHGAVGLPLYVLYPAKGGTPRILPTLLTPAIARQALLEAAP